MVACSHGTVTLLRYSTIVLIGTRGENSVGQLGIGMKLFQHTSSQVRVGSSVPRQIPPEAFGDKRILRVACGGTQCFAVCGTRFFSLLWIELMRPLIHSVSSDDGVLFTWGRNSEGFLGLGHQNDQTVPVRIVASQCRCCAAVSNCRWQHRRV